MNLDLQGKTVLVTGSTRGIGAAIADRFEEEGAAVIRHGRHGRHDRSTDSLSTSGKSVFGDLTNPADCTRVIAEVQSQFGGIDILINNVGGGRYIEPLTESSQDWLAALELNLLSASRMTSLAQESLIERRGTVVCISSICGEAALGASAPYSAAKAGLQSFVRTVARTLGPKGVRINAVAPGHIYFEGGVWDRRTKENPEKVKKMIEQDIPLGRLGTPAEIADAVVFLASPRASYVQGTVWIVDGGTVRA